MRTLALTALAAAALATPAGATVGTPAPVSGACVWNVVATNPAFPTVVLTAYATTTQPALEVGVSCWIAEGGYGRANGNNPGVAVVAAGTGTIYRVGFTVCEQRWARWVDGTSYTSPVTCR